MLSFCPMVTGSVSPSLQGVLQAVDEFLETPGDVKTLPGSQQHCVATHLLLDLEGVLRVLSQAMPEGSATFNYSAGSGKYPGLPPAPALPIPASFLFHPH
jgi:hypothetical protein